MKYPFQNLGVTKSEDFLNPELFYSFAEKNFIEKEKENNEKHRRSNLLNKS